MTADPTPEEIERGRLLFARPCVFLLGVIDPAQLPEETTPEVAFAGRSNVGKSSLLNAMTGQKSLARASSTPGRTRQVNYFDAGGALKLVDLPGYGHAKAPKSEIAAWTALMRNFLKGRAGLRRVLLLVDARRALSAADTEMTALLDDAAVSYQIVLTKADKVKAHELVAVEAAIVKALAKRPAAHPVVAVTSAETGLGIAELRAELAAIAETGGSTLP